MRTSDFDYHLPPELIAQTPVEPRDSSRLLILRRDTGALEHRQFSDLGQHLPPGCVLVMNRSRVLPARLYGRRQDTGGRVELLLLRRESPGIWQALGQPGRRLRPGVKLWLTAPGDNPAGGGDPAAANPAGGGDPAAANPAGKAADYDEDGAAVAAEILAVNSEGVRTVRLSTESGIEPLGQVPLPPYIRQRLADPERYQTVYAQEPGSVAAPTAGLHFTPQLLDNLRQAGISTAFVTLHVGLDTFRPVKGDDPREHHIHTEYYELPADTAAALTQARQQGRPIIAVGTTAVRTLEQVGRDQAASIDREEPVLPAQGQADLFILPGHQFCLVDGMITNFHLPRSTLLMLVSAFAGRENILAAYQAAVAQGYRFYSFGDAMLIL